MDAHVEDDDLGEWPGPPEPESPATLGLALAGLAAAITGATLRKAARIVSNHRAAQGPPGQ